MKKIVFPVLLVFVVLLAMLYPEIFLNWRGFESSLLIVPLLQVIMFGVGTEMSLRDFLGVIQMPKGVIVGMICQFTIMPLLGFTLAKGFDFPSEIAAGLILVGSSPSGLASNVMSYLAKANLALSVTMTAVATAIAPVLTPFLMSMLGGEFVPVDFFGMMWSIVQIVIIPVSLGLAFNGFMKGKIKWLDQLMPGISMGGIILIIGVITANGRESLMEIGLLLILACFLHNALGYILGFFASKLAGLDQKSCKTIALEVGMQNSGLASGIALQMGKIATVGLAPAVFGPLMNFTGSLLASYWRKKSEENQ
ncbi:bile acid:sodium symporter family protein [Algoriphagus sp. CAU 1675]|uniref:bile acid:sodium symporter family protein n=1 Tax=Algoriphagus sp. CAU 1675 TaxID=3032597 RepID=UPI0023DB0314|nr:bile acid:sodium symporter family protein [Algoriphagus sp. CAU 1675]MDF2156743.1 bile acid:sodium symporter family protein [Algoriphagus sp. CAU 1675]